MVRIRSMFARFTGPNLFLLLLLLSLVRCHRAEPTPPWPLQKSGIPKQAANGLLERLDRIASSREAFSLSVTDEELTSLSRVYLADSGITEPHVLITTQGLYARATVRLHAPYTVRFLVAGEIRDGAPRANILRAAVNDRDVPRVLLRCLDQVIQVILADMAWPVRIEHITFSEGHLLVQGAPHSNIAR